ncbi:NADH-cytochrome b5 reductase [Rhizoclosmatium sp. JEL0117]|nr:NADH-cytochrome b5 reductase [Rhizoclosmatium sp. JEL0117]
MTIAELQQKYKTNPTPALTDNSVFVPFKLLETQVITHNTSRFIFALPEGTTHLGLPTASCLVTRFTDASGTEVIRPYTPIEDPNLGYTGKFELIVKHYVGGPMSTHIFSLKAGDFLDMKGPILKYQYVANRDRHIGLIAGGTGITPHLQILQRGLGDDKDDTKFTLLFANVTEQDILLREYLDELAAKHKDRFTLHYLLDNPPANWTGRTGRVTKEVIQETLPKPGEGKVFVCGPLPMVASLSGLKNKDFTQGELSGALAELGYFNPFYAPGWQIYDDLSIQHATQLLNANSSILQNTSIKLKHFNFYDPDYAYDIYATSSLGYAGLVALNITQNPENSDIVAVIGGWSGDPVKIEAEIYSQYNIPYCGIIPPDSIFDNKYNYKSFFRTTWSRYGYELHVLKFLQTHNVTRIGIVTYGSPLSQRLQDTLTANGIDIPAFAIAPGYEDVNSAITMLKTQDVRYIYVDLGSAESTAHLYFPAVDAGIVGPDYVWMSMDYPSFAGQETVFPNRSFDVDTKGFVFIYGAPLLNWNGTDYPPAYNELNNSMYSNWPIVDEIPIENLNMSIPTSELPYFSPQGYMENAFNCIMTLASGMDTLLRRNKALTPEMLAKRQIQDKLNLSLWKQSGYRGIGNVPLEFNDVGSVKVAFYWITTVSSTYPISMITWPDLSISQYPEVTVFNGNGTKWPSDGAIKKTRIALINEEQATLVYVLEAIGIFVSVFCIIVQIVLGNQGRTDSNSYMFGLIALGSLLNYLSLSFYVGHPNVKACLLRVWLPFSGLPLILLSIIFKNVRVYYIFRSRTIIQKWKLSNLLPVSFVFGGLFLFPGILIVWAFQNQPSTHLVKLSASVMTTTCLNSHDGMNTVIAFGILSGTLVLALLVLAYKTRDISHEYNESIQMLFIGVFCIIMTGTLAPSIFFSTPSTKQLVSEVLFVWLPTTVVIFTYLLPKVAVKIMDSGWLDHARKTRLRLSERISHIKSKSALNSSNSIMNTPRQTRLLNQFPSASATFSKVVPIPVKGVVTFQLESLLLQEPWNWTSISICSHSCKSLPWLMLSCPQSFQSIPIHRIIDIQKVQSDNCHILVIRRKNFWACGFFSTRALKFEFENCEDLEIAEKVITEAKVNVKE